MDIFQERELRQLLEEHAGPKVSIYIPTHRGGSQMDFLRYRNAVHHAQQRLVAQGMRSPDARKLLAPFESLQKDDDFWKHTSDGLAVFANKDFLHAYRLPWSFEERLEVGDLFLITPILPMLYDDTRFFILALSQNKVRLLQGTHYSVQEIDAEELPKNLEEALQSHDRDKVLTFHTRPKPGTGWGAIFQGHGTGIDDVKDNLKLFFRQIDRGLHPVLKNETAPLVLAAVEYLHPLYREKNTYAHLEEVGIAGNPEHWSDEELRDRAWVLLEPNLKRKKEIKAEKFHSQKNSGKAISNTLEILHAAARGNVETLFVSLERPVRGYPPVDGGDWILHDGLQPGDADLANIAAVNTLRHHHTVQVLHEKEMPEEMGMAASLFAPVSYELS
jgi:hypothetical protein